MKDPKAKSAALRRSNTTAASHKTAVAEAEAVAEAVAVHVENTYYRLKPVNHEPMVFNLNDSTSEVCPGDRVRLLNGRVVQAVQPHHEGFDAPDAGFEFTCDGCVFRTEVLGCNADDLGCPACVNTGGTVVYEDDVDWEVTPHTVVRIYADSTWEYKLPEYDTAVSHIEERVPSTNSETGEYCSDSEIQNWLGERGYKSLRKR